MSMIDTTKAIALALSLGMTAGAAVAQDSTTPAAPAAEAPAAEAPAVDATTPAAPGSEAPAAPAPAAEAPAGAAAPAADGLGSVYLKGTEGDWQMRCIRVEADQIEPCQMYQLLKDKDGNSVAEVSLFPLPAGQQAVTGATISVPLETLLTANLTLQIDQSKPRVYPFTWCDRESCIARVGFTKEDLAALKAGNKGTLTIVPVIAPDQQVNLSLSLKGFTKSYDSMPVPPLPQQ
ncbi:invasion associated locus B family protein [Gemmobacter serpentinus]|uniref:invasion associated locus B family protein n=1 Tax=Gemmobacter serpentinus TaxID=2652247 RepID=UPI00124D7749|nr:invasion associated locus B family protein [Gemmobacter serpentinus]